MSAEFSSVGMLAAALGVGALHALDADHIMAVSSLTARRPKATECLRIGIRWSLGHGVTLLTLGCLPFLIGHAMPAGFAVYAERAVALLLAVIGLSVLFDLATGGARLRIHRHPGMRPHLHWVVPDAGHEDRATGAHAAVLVGAMHGLAGSAPLIALIPAGTQGDVGGALLVLLAFSIGVLSMMVLFGAVLGAVIERSDRGLDWIRAAAGGGSVLLGTAIFVGSL